MKKTWFLASAAVAIAAVAMAYAGDELSAELVDGGALVKVRGLEFALPARGRLTMREGGVSTPILSHNIRIAGEAGMVAAYEDHRADRPIEHHAALVVVVEDLGVLDRHAVDLRVDTVDHQRGLFDRHVQAVPFRLVREKGGFCLVG